MENTMETFNHFECRVYRDRFRVYPPDNYLSESFLEQPNRLAAVYHPIGPKP